MTGIVFAGSGLLVHHLVGQGPVGVVAMCGVSQGEHITTERDVTCARCIAVLDEISTSVKDVVAEAVSAEFQKHTTPSEHGLVTAVVAALAAVGIHGYVS